MRVRSSPLAVMGMPSICPSQDYIFHMLELLFHWMLSALLVKNIRGFAWHCAPHSGSVSVCFALPVARALPLQVTNVWLHRFLIMALTGLHCIWPASKLKSTLNACNTKYSLRKLCLTSLLLHCWLKGDNFTRFGEAYRSTLFVGKLSRMSYPPLTISLVVNDATAKSLTDFSSSTTDTDSVAWDPSLPCDRGMRAVSPVPVFSSSIA